MFRKEYGVLEEGIDGSREKGKFFRKLKRFLLGTKDLVSDASDIQRDMAKGMYYMPMTGAYLFSAALILTAIYDVARGEYMLGTEKVATGLGLSYGVKRLSGRNLKMDTMPSI